MGFYTTASCYRAGPHPPVITGADLSTFCRQVEEMDIIDPDMPWAVRLKYGRAIDQDDRSTYRERKVSKHSVEMLHYVWDVEELRVTAAEALDMLQQPPARQSYGELIGQVRRKPASPNIYRASIDMSFLRDEFTTTINHELEGNCLYFNDLYFSIDVVIIRDADTMYEFEVGWMALKIGGNGYPFPWTYEETLQRIREHPQLSALRGTCRSLWPASDQAVSSEAIEARKMMGKFWAEPLDAPYDWYWVIQGVV